MYSACLSVGSQSEPVALTVSKQAEANAQQGGQNPRRGFWGRRKSPVKKRQPTSQKETELHVITRPVLDSPSPGSEQSKAEAATPTEGPSLQAEALPRREEPKKAENSTDSLQQPSPSSPWKANTISEAFSGVGSDESVISKEGGVQEVDKEEAEKEAMDAQSKARSLGTDVSL